MRLNSFETVFVSRVPDKIEKGILYVCMECNLVVHLCPCGCGEKVVLPIDSNQWILSYDGSGITLSPSVGNYQFKCMSHYYIRNSEVVWIPSSNQSPKKKQKRIIGSKNCILYYSELRDKKSVRLEVFLALLVFTIINE